MDASSLQNINLAFDTFKEHPAINARAATAIGRDALIASTDAYFNYLVESITKARANTGSVSITERNHLIADKNMPDMFFYPTCRHGYREALAKFDNKKAYFVKIKEIRFERNIHGALSNKEVYKFNPGDQINNEHSDFTVSGGKWVINV